MLKKSLETLKNNPAFIIVYVIAMVLFAAAFILILPEFGKITEISNQISKTTPDTLNIDSQQIVDFIFAIIKILIFSLFAFVLALLCMSGFGNMLSQAVNDEKTSISSFFTGIRKNFIRTLLFFLLIAAFSLGFGIIVSLISIPFTLVKTLNSTVTNIYDYESIYESQRIITSISSLLTIFVYPFIVLWIPSIYLDRNDGIITTLKKGFKAGIKNYKLLVVVSAVMILPSVAFMIFNKNSDVAFTSPAYIALNLYEFVIVPIILVYLFTLYNRIRNLKPGNSDINPHS